MSGGQSVRQQARRAAMAAQTKRKKEAEARDRRRRDLAVKVMIGLKERDACELDAARALRRLVEDEKLTMKEAIQWCGGELTVSQGSRLKALATDAASVSASGDDADGDAGVAPARDEDGS